MYHTTMPPPQQLLATADPVLARLIADLPVPVVHSTNDVFFDLMSCVLEQQIHYRSTKKVFEKMLKTASLQTLSPQNFEAFAEKALIKTTLSASKLETVEQIVAFWQTQDVTWHTLSDEAVAHILSAIKGIGRWTIDMLLLYTLKRPNVFPVDDFHLKAVMVRLYGLDAKSRLKAQMLDVAAHWGDQKSLAVLYLLDWKKQQKKALSAAL
jgi:DNA-3-methyladenine glycosylase II